MKTGRRILSFLLLVCSNCFSQNNPYGFTPWKLISISGEVKTKASYREMKSENNYYSYKQKSSYLMGGALLKTRSFFLHPNFLLVDLDASYYPETSRDKFMISIPDQAEVRTTKNLYARAALFNQRKVSLTSTASFTESFQNRENLTNIKINSKLWEEAFVYRSKILPLAVNFQKNQWEQSEIGTPRRLSRDELSLRGRTNKSFTKRDKNELSYAHYDYVSVNENAYRIANTIDNFNFTSNVFLDAQKTNFFNSMISNYDQHGNVNYNRFQTSENLFLKLSRNLVFSTNYTLGIDRQELNKSYQNGINSSLSHQLYRSLHSSLLFGYNRTSHTLFKEDIFRSGVILNYTKKIPAKGMLSLMYSFSRLHEKMNSNPVSLQTNREEYFLSDNQITLFQRANVVTQSVLVKDITGTIVYVLNVDYILIEHSPYLEIRRIPGGLIANNTSVYADYTAIKPGAYQYDTDNNSFAAIVTLFDHKLEVYYRLSSIKNNNTVNTEYVTLNSLTQNVVGVKLDFGFINGGAEYEDYKSNVIPFRRTWYFINIQKSYNQRFSFGLNGNIQNIQLLNEGSFRRYSDVSGKIDYAIAKQTKVNLNLMYRNQQGGGIDLNLFTAKCDITSVLRQLYITFGAELYRTEYVGAKINFKGAYISLLRKF